MSPRARRLCRRGPHAAEPGQPYCRVHTAEAERERGSKQARGYDAAHDRLRAAWAPRVARGGVLCWRCEEPIVPGTKWVLGHLDDRSQYGGPEHEHCNAVAAGKARWR